MISSFFEWRRHSNRLPCAASYQSARQDAGRPTIDALEGPLLEARQVRKSFGESAAVLSADLEVRRGEIHAIVGANGSGKTTLASTIAGVHAPDAGELRLSGRPVRFSSPRDAQQHGIVAIQQEPLFVPDLTVADNIFLGAELRYGRVPLLQRRQMHEQAAELLRTLGATFDASVSLGKLGLAERQLVAIARALSRNVTLCILDEPTAALGTLEIERLFDVLRRLRAQGAGVIYISHQLDEVLTLADRVTIMRDGRTVQSIMVADVTRESLISQFVGSGGLGEQGSERIVEQPGRPIALQVEQLSRRNEFEDISFQVAAGEIYGLAGLTGSGRSRIARGIFGVDPLDKGQVRIYGRPVRIRSPRDAIKAGIGMLPEDRTLDGLILCQPANENVALPIWERIAHAGLVTPGLGLRIAARLIAQLGIGAPQRSCAVAGLSGGNQQKIVLAKWVATLPKVLILDEPTRGIDISAKAEIYALIRYVAAQGIGMLIICSELPELLSLADRVGVVRQGHIVAEFTRKAATEELVFQHALGKVSASEQEFEAVGSQEHRPPWACGRVDASEGGAVTVAVNARDKARAVTIADVARIANVVPSTVSHALNGTAPISKEVRERILRIARELNYRPSAVARSLLSGRTMTVGMLVADILDPHCPDIVGGVEAGLARARHDLMLCSAAGSTDRMAAFLASLASKCVDAVIVVTDGLSAEMRASVAASPVPVVLVSSATGVVDVDAQVTLDLMAGLRAACEHLRELGHRHVAFMTDVLSGGDAHEGIAIAAWEQSGGTRQDALIVPGNARLDGGRMALELVLAARPRPTALIAVSDMAAIGVIQGAEEQGLRIPQFLSVIGIGDIVSASLVNPPLTTVALPRREIGEAAALRALRLLDGEAKPAGTEQEWLPTSLVIRRSTGAPPRR